MCIRRLVTRSREEFPDGKRSGRSFPNDLSAQRQERGRMTREEPISQDLYEDFGLTLEDRLPRPMGRYTV